MKRIAVLLLLCLFLVGCTGNTQADRTFFAMDTVIQLQIWGRESDAGAEAVEQLLHQLEAQWSATDPESTIGKLNRGLRIGLRPEELQVLDKARKLSERTGGCFDPMLYDVMKAWGFYDQNHRIPTQAELTQALSQERWDLGGVIKGYAGQVAADGIGEVHQPSGKAGIVHDDAGGDEQRNGQQRRRFCVFDELLHDDLSRHHGFQEAEIGNHTHKER